MAHRTRNSGRCATVEGLRVQLIPVKLESSLSNERSRQIHRLVANIILLSRKRGRPVINEREVDFAA